MLETLPAPRVSGIRDVVVLATIRSSATDGIYDYTCRLENSLSADHSVRVVNCNPLTEPLEGFRSLLPEGEGGGTMTVVLQYNPFNFGRWGFAPWLPKKLWQLRRLSPRIRIALMAHEMYVPVRDWRTALMGAWQRAQLVVVRALSDVVFSSVGLWADRLRAGRPRRRVYHLPVASNLPDMRHARSGMRARLGADERTVVLASFGTNHPDRLPDYIRTATAAVAATGVGTILLNLGADVPLVEAGPDVRVLTPGRLEDEEVAAYLAAADIFLAPLHDGVSTRRTTMMAALQHGLPVVGTDGELTDDTLRQEQDALRLIPVGDRDSFAQAASELAADPASRTRRGAEARLLYERRFDWPVLSARLLAALREGAE